MFYLWLVLGSKGNLIIDDKVPLLFNSVLLISGLADDAVRLQVVEEVVDKKLRFTIFKPSLGSGTSPNNSLTNGGTGGELGKVRGIRLSLHSKGRSSWERVDFA